VIEYVQRDEWFRALITKRRVTSEQAKALAKSRATMFTGRKIEDDNEADALCLLEYTCIKHGIAALRGGKG